MRIAITGDVHLTNRAEHPERYHALENILEQMISDQISDLIIAGDLFDADSHNYSEFDELCMQDSYKSIQFHIIPGNHDALLNSKQFIAPNIEVFDKPRIISFGESDLKFLLLPFQDGSTMGEGIAEHFPVFEGQNWVLVSHGDYLGGMREVNPYEPGTYMPLTSRDIDRFKPSKVILGHIHKGMDDGTLYYPGSLCGLNITETGYRHYLIIDTTNMAVSLRRIDNEKIFFDEVLTVIPTDDEMDYVKDLIRRMIEKWGLEEEDKSKVVVRLAIRGFINDKSKLKNTIEEELSDYTMYADNGLGLTRVSTPSDVGQVEIAQKVLQYVDQMEWSVKEELPTKDDIKIYALETVFGVD